jgi:hypothetical protein
VILSRDLSLDLRHLFGSPTVLLEALGQARGLMAPHPRSPDRKRVLSVIAPFVLDGER